jgi:putative nucleotidyltransferase with HDIG domain
MQKSQNLFFGTIALAAVVICVALWPYAELRALAREDVIGLIMLMSVAYLSEALPFFFETGSKLAVSIATLPFLACVVLFPPGVAVPAISLTVLASNTYPHRRSPRSAIFNVSQAVIAVSISGWLYHALLPTESARTAPIGIPPFVVLAIVISLLNMALVSGGLAVIRGQRYRLVLGEVVGQKAGNLLHGLLASPIALIIVMLYDRFSAVGIILVLLPLLLVRISFANNVALVKANKDLLKVLIKAIETRDPYTSGHSLRVATLAIAIAEDMGLSKQKVDEVEIAALLHDVGKIDPAFSAVIRKPYDLSPEERALIQTHAALGADLLQNLKSVRAPIIDAVRHHHERMDGKGYPDGLTGDAIPQAARIIMLCDSIDAMLSDRPYRKALPLDRVRQELIRCSGDQFDAEIVRVVLQKDTLTRACTLIDTVSGFEDEYLIRAHG